MAKTGARPASPEADALSARRVILAKFVLTVTIGDLAARDAARPKHREYLNQLFSDGKLLEAGPFADGTGSLFIYEAAGEAEARALFAADPYSLTSGVVERAEFREWVRVFPPSV